MNKKKTSVVLAIVFVVTTLVMPPGERSKMVHAETVSLRTIENESEISNIKVQTKYQRMVAYLDYKKAEKEYLDKVAIRDSEVARITESNNRKNNVHFNPDNLLSVSNITVNELNSIFVIKDKPYMLEIIQALVDAEKEYGVNALFLAGLVAQESYWAEIPAGNGDNLTGMGVFNPGYIGHTYGGSRYRNILATAEVIKNEYLTPTGNFYNGISTAAVNVRYCLKAFSSETDYEWSYNINSIATDLNNIYHTQVKMFEELPEEVPYPEELKNKPFTEWEEQNIWKLI